MPTPFLLLLARGAIVLWLAILSGQANAAEPTRFTVKERNGESWLFSALGGAGFFSRGVCCVNTGASREAHDPENPGYAYWQHYGGTEEWGQETGERLASWGFTTIGAWSDFEALRHSRGLYFMPVLHIGSTAGAPWWDMWDSDNLRRMDEVARTQISALRGDPRVIGYYSDNELGWWNATLWKMTLEQPSSSGQRRRLMTLLEEVYQRDWNRLRRDFDVEDAGNWRQLRKGGMLYLRSGSQGIHTMRRFLGLLAERYYGLMRHFIRKHDPAALYLGDRYQSFYYPEVARASAAYVDVSSSNLNAHWNDGTFLRCYLDTLRGLTGRPIPVSEFYSASNENRSGNRNDSGVFPVTATQEERAAAARRTLEAITDLPYTVGAEWFQYYDEPTHGRDDGENFNFGLVDIHNQPYAGLVKAFADFDAFARKNRPRKARADASQGVPPAPADPFAEFRVTQALKAWDRERGFVKPSSPYPLADLYLAWSPQSLYLGLHSTDMIEAAYYRGPSVPKIDRPLWVVRLDGKEIVRARIGAGREPLRNEPRVRIENVSGLNLNVRDIAAMEIPAGLLGRNGLKAGETLELECTLWTHCRAYQVEWRGKFSLAE